MNLLERLQNDLKTAMRARDTLRVEVIRMGINAIKNAQMAMVKDAFDAAGEEAADTIDRNQALGDQAMQDALTKEVRKRHEAAELFRKGHREELAEREEAEALILEEYLPRLMTADELRPLIADVIAGLGLSGTAAMGKIMPAVMGQFKGRADGRVINQVVREILSQS
ncbi:MAG: GatB/YqeY domain-containing protein [Roseiflexaceae bacterium]|nr:GatB/YqeY domain-containing protein [Roseiflexaceae bacterium]